MMKAIRKRKILVTKFNDIFITHTGISSLLNQGQKVNTAVMGSDSFCHISMA